MNQDQCLSSVQENQFKAETKQASNYRQNRYENDVFQAANFTKNDKNNGSYKINEKQKLRSSETGYQLHLPEPSKQAQQLARNKTRHGRRGKIMIQKLSDQHEQPLQIVEQPSRIPIRSEKNLIIYDLLDQQENQEQIAQNISSVISLKKQLMEKTQKEIPNNQHLQTLQQIASNDHNSFLQVEEKNEKSQNHDIKNSQEVSVTEKELHEQEIFHKVDLLVNQQLPVKEDKTNEKQQDKVEVKQDIIFVQKSRLRDGTKSKESNLKQGFFYGKNEDNQFDYVRVDSKSSLDTGPQLTTSRDQHSSRHIIDYSNILSAQKIKRRLPALQPLNKLLQKQQQKLYEMRQYEKLQVIEQKQKSMILLKNGKFGIQSHDIQDICSFVRSPIPFNRTLQSTITRNKSCQKWYLDYDLSTNDDKYLLSCKKIPFNLGSTYRISLLKGQFNTNSEYLIGEVKGNFVGSTFNICIPKADDPTNLELEATVFYYTQWDCCKNSCRNIEIFLKNRSYPIEQLQGTLHKGKNLKELYLVNENCQRKRIKKYVNKKPVWNEARQTFVLNLRGKSRFSSVKNMMLVDEQEMNEETIIIAKKANNQFELDISYPFSPVVALGVAMTGFDFKLASQ